MNTWKSTREDVEHAGVQNFDKSSLTNYYIRLWYAVICQEIIFLFLPQMIEAVLTHLSDSVDVQEASRMNIILSALYLARTSSIAVGRKKKKELLDGDLYRNAILTHAYQMCVFVIRGRQFEKAIGLESRRVYTCQTYSPHSMINTVWSEICFRRKRCHLARWRHSKSVKRLNNLQTAMMLFRLVSQFFERGWHRQPSDERHQLWRPDKELEGRLSFFLIYGAKTRQSGSHCTYFNGWTVLCSCDLRSAWHF